MSVLSTGGTDCAWSGLDKRLLSHHMAGSDQNEHLFNQLSAILDKSSLSMSTPLPHQTAESDSQTPESSDQTTPVPAPQQDPNQDEDPEEDEPQVLDAEQRAALIRYLEQRVRDNIESVNSSDWDTLFNSRDVSPNFEHIPDGCTRPITWHEMIRLRQASRDRFPGATVRLVSVSTHINAAANHAAVFALLEVFHPHTRIRGEKMMVYEFDKIRGLWLHSRRTSLRAPMVLIEPSEPPW